MADADPRPDTPVVAGLVLAGGRSRRMGWEKALVRLDGRPLLSWSLAGLAEACDPIAVCAPFSSTTASLARELGFAVISDRAGDPAGPLAGILAGLLWAEAAGARWLVTAPCDMPHLPADIVPRLLANAVGGRGACATGPDGRQPLCAVWDPGLAMELADTLRSGHPPVWQVQARFGFREVHFTQTAAFENVNAAPALETSRRAWDLTSDGPPMRTHTSWLQPVTWRGESAMLKVPANEEERRGSAALSWFNGVGAARVLQFDGTALLMERLADDRPLTTMAQRGVAGDQEATGILCAAVGRLHLSRPAPPPEATPLAVWFEALRRRAEAGGVLATAWAEAKALLEANRDPRVLHGDIHHENILHDPARGWAAIDPKGLFGPRGYDYANLLRNPLTPLARDRARLDRNARQVAQLSGLPLAEVLGWTLAHAGLSACWSLDAADDATHSLAVAANAAALLSAIAPTPRP